jgi:hypothetical protein
VLATCSWAGTWWCLPNVNEPIFGLDDKPIKFWFILKS